MRADNSSRPWPQRKGNTQSARQEPFAAVPHALRKDPRLKPIDVALVCALLEYARSKASCWPSNATLAEDLHRRSRRTVQVALGRLRDAGYVRVELGADNPTGRLIVLVWRENAAPCAPPSRSDARGAVPVIAPEPPLAEKERKEKPRAGVVGTPAAEQMEESLEARIDGLRAIFDDPASVPWQRRLAAANLRDIGVATHGIPGLCVPPVSRPAPRVGAPLLGRALSADHLARQLGTRP